MSIENAARLIREYSNLKDADLLKIVIVDFETCSEVDIRASSYQTYATGDHAAVLMMLYASEGDEEPQAFYTGNKLLPGFLMNPERYIIVAFNLQFDRAIWNHTLQPTDKRIQKLPLRHCVDAMALANMMGNHGSLNQVCESLGLGSKLNAGKQIITNTKTRCTRNVALALEGKDLLPVLSLGEQLQLEEYGLQDVKLTVALLARLSKEYYARSTGKACQLALYKERLLWLHTAKRNEEGIRVDMGLLKEVIEFGQQEKRRASADLTKILARYEDKIYTEEDDVVPTWYNVTRREPILRFLKYKGIEADSLDKTSRKTILKHSKCDDDVQSVIDVIDLANNAAIRRAKKVYTEALKTGGVVRDYLAYFGAHTGRWAGRRLQIQNLPRVSEDPIALLDELRKLKANKYRVAELPISGDQVGQLLRMALMPTDPNKQYLIIDFSNIEARILADLSKEEVLLEKFRNKEDVYIHMAALITGIPAETIAKDSPERRLGKACVLGLGYGMGAERFKLVLKQTGINTFSEEEIVGIVKKWRALNKNICALWRIKETEAKKYLRAHRCTTPETAKKLVYRLPSGRMFHLGKCHLVVEDTRDTIVTPGRGGTYKTIWGGLLVENIVQATARDILAHAILTCNPTFHIHDEIVIEVPKGHTQEGRDRIIDRVINQFETYPTLPLAVEHYVSDRFSSSGFGIKEEELTGL